MNNGNQILAGIYARCYAPIVDLELKLGCGTSGPQRIPFGGFICSHCNKCFISLQALGGHQTAHRNEMEELRRQQYAIVENNGFHLAPLPSKEATPLHHRLMVGTHSFGGTIDRLDLSRFRKGVESQDMRFVNLELTLGTLEKDIDLSLTL